MFFLDHLPNQRPNERVELFLRRHWITLVSLVVSSLFLLAIPTAIGWGLWPHIEPLLTDVFIGPFLIVLASVYVLSVWLFTFLQFTDYYLDTWIVTNERIINIEQQGLFHRTASELDLAAVQDTTAEIRGFLQTILGYGNVFVQTAGEKGRFHFKNIGDAEHVKELVTRLVEEDKQNMTLRGKVKTVIK